MRGDPAETVHVVEAVPIGAARQDGRVFEAVVGAGDHVPAGRGLMDQLPGAVLALGPLHLKKQIVGFGGGLPFDQHACSLGRGPEIEQGDAGPDRDGQDDEQQAKEENAATEGKHG